MMPAGKDVSFTVRLEQYMARRGLSPAELARRAGLSGATVSRYLSGERTPSYDNLRKLAKALRVSLDDLSGDTFDKRSEDISEVLDSVVSEAKKRLGLPPLKETFSVGETGRNLPAIPLIGTLSEASRVAFDPEGRPLGRWKTTISRAGDDDPDAYGMILDNDSMEPVIAEGWPIVVGPNSEWQNGQLAIVRFEDGDIRLGRVFEKDESFLIQSYNPDYEPQLILKTKIAFVHRVISIRPA